MSASRLPAVALFAALALAGGARAETPAPQLATPLPADAAQALKSAVFAEAAVGKGVGLSRVAVEHRFDGKAQATGSLGFLCGRPDSLDARAAASPLGSDPHGRFLGARLSFAFR
jgi:hypothetical protein